MNLLFIDTNVYLRFYDTNKTEFKKLLKSLVELEGNIFITKQIVDEINRNKLSVFKQSTDNYKRQINVISTFLPEHLDGGSNSQMSDWNKNRKKIEQDIKLSNQSYDSIIKDTIKDISLSKDTISIQLNPIIARAKTANEDILKLAKTRRLMGNPPGKSSDPLGDQLSWEQLLAQVNEVSGLWVISHDFDFYTIHEKECHLNPVLYQDLITLNPTIEVKCFNALADALKDFDKTTKILALPSEEELSVIANEEVRTNNQIVFFGAGIEFEPDAPTFCPHCQQASTFTNVYVKDEITGYSSLRFLCDRCKNIYTRGNQF